MPRRGDADNVRGWKETFVQLMKEYKPQDKWILDVVDDLCEPPRGWYMYEQKQLFARFDCSNCGKEWKSAQVVVRLFMHLENSRWGPSQGQVKVRIFRQKCHRCRMPRYEDPTFSDETVQRLLHNLVLKILEKCYGAPLKHSQFLKHEAEEDVEGPHDRDNCEACEHGVCSSSRPITRAESKLQPKQEKFPEILLLLLVIFLLLFAYFTQKM